jgi:hypothetical protein
MRLLGNVHIPKNRKRLKATTACPSADSEICAGCAPLSPFARSSILNPVKQHLPSAIFSLQNLRNCRLPEANFSHQCLAQFLGMLCSFHDALLSAFPHPLLNIFLFHDQDKNKTIKHERQ